MLERNKHRVQEQMNKHKQNIGAAGDAAAAAEDVAGYDVGDKGSSSSSKRVEEDLGGGLAAAPAVGRRLSTSSSSRSSNVVGSNLSTATTSSSSSSSGSSSSSVIGSSKSKQKLPESFIAAQRWVVADQRGQLITIRKTEIIFNYFCK
jgi:hypothetical protein